MTTVLMDRDANLWLHVIEAAPKTFILGFQFKHRTMWFTNWFDAEAFWNSHGFESLGEL